MVHGRRRAETPWPDHPELPDHGVVIRRDVLDERLRDRARSAGATVLMGHEATSPHRRPRFRPRSDQVLADGATCDISARFIVVADGASSRFGRVLGTCRQHQWPYAIAARTYFASPRHRDPWVETSLGLPDSHGNPIAGYGWVTPMGDGNVNVGVGVLSSYRDIKSLNTLKLLGVVLRADRDRLGHRCDATAQGPDTSPLADRRFGRAEDGSDVPRPRRCGGCGEPLQRRRHRCRVDGWPARCRCVGRGADHRQLDHIAAVPGRSSPKNSSRYRKVGRLSARFLGRPAILKPALRLATRSDATMGAVLRIATNELRDDQSARGAERAYRLASLVSKFAPSW